MIGLDEEAMCKTAEWQNLILSYTTLTLALASLDTFALSMLVSTYLRRTPELSQLYAEIPPHFPFCAEERLSPFSS
jgi:hypothetical protein